MLSLSTNIILEDSKQFRRAASTKILFHHKLLTTLFVRFGDWTKSALLILLFSWCWKPFLAPTQIERFFLLKGKQCL